jgi:hypothetical protein
MYVEFHLFIKLTAVISKFFLFQGKYNHTEKAFREQLTYLRSTFYFYYLIFTNVVNHYCQGSVRSNTPYIFCRHILTMLVANFSVLTKKMAPPMQDVNKLYCRENNYDTLY